MDPISCDFSPKVCVKYLEAKYWTYWIAFNNYYISRQYLMDLISCDFFQRFVLSILKQNIGSIGPWLINAS